MNYSTENCSEEISNSAFQYSVLIQIMKDLERKMKGRMKNRISSLVLKRAVIKDLDQELSSDN